MNVLVIHDNPFVIAGLQRVLPLALEKEAQITYRDPVHDDPSSVRSEGCDIILSFDNLRYLKDVLYKRKEPIIALMMVDPIQVAERVEQLEQYVQGVAYAVQYRAIEKAIFEVLEFGRSFPQSIAKQMLSEKEYAVAKLYKRCYSNSQICKELYMASGTVSAHYRKIAEKLELDSIKEILKSDYYV